MSAKKLAFAAVFALSAAWPDELEATLEGARAVKDEGGTLKKAFEIVHAQLAPRYAGFPIFEHCMPFNVQRTWDELDGIDHPRIWTAERDREVWATLQD